ncbi:glycosyltransferase family 2 protein [Streptomyces roseifaciens]
MHQVTTPGVLTVVVTHAAPRTLPLVLTTLTAQCPASATAVLYTGPPTGPSADRATGACHHTGTTLLTVGASVRIGTARAWLLDHLARSGARWTHVAFLDDDCPPNPGWWKAAQRSTGAALTFGPRYPAAVHGAGARVRAWEAGHSAKIRGARDHRRPVEDPPMMVAGGNMIVEVATAHHLGVTDAAFADGAFEDVDYQLRLRAHGATVTFDPDLAVNHHDQLSATALLRKSVMSGTGLAQCVQRHGPRLWQCSRWQPGPVLARTLRQTAPGADCPLPPSLRVLAAARATVVLAAYTTTRLRQILPLRPHRSRPDTPQVGCCRSSGSKLRLAPLSPSQQTCRVEW